MALALAASAACDVLITLDQMGGGGHWKPVVISVFSSANLLALGLVSVSVELVPPERASRADALASSDTGVGKSTPSAVDLQRDADILQRLTPLMEDEQLYLDPDLTLNRLSRRLSTPAKQVSAAINRQFGESVSRHVNADRIRHACPLLLSGYSVTRTVFDSGFTTRSNFNREFQRQLQCSPSEWLNKQ